MGKSTTLSDIARISGVSRQVVSAILNPQNGGNIRYSRETYQRVIKTAKEANYRPNRAATNLVRNRHGALGILINKTGAIPSQSLQHLLYLSKRHDLIISIESCSPEDQLLPIFIREDCVDGIIMFENFSFDLVNHLEKLDIPLLFVNTNRRDSVDAITFDEYNAMNTAVQLFCSKGQTRLVFVVPDAETFAEPRHYSIAARQEGLRKACLEHKIPDPLILEQSTSYSDPDFDKQAYILYKKFLQDHPEINAAVLYNDMQAPAFYQAAYDLGKKIPADIAVLGIHFTTVRTRLLPALSVQQINPEELAKTIIRTMEERRLGSYRSKKPCIMRYELLEAGST